MGDSFQLKATALLTDHSVTDVTSGATWETSDAAIASVSATGLVTAKQAGDVRISATYENQTDLVRPGNESGVRLLNERRDQRIAADLRRWEMKTGVVVAALVALVTGTDLAAVQDEFYMLAGFDIAVMRTATGVSLACMAGCSWKALEFPLTLSGKPTPVNEDGIADNKTANSEKDGHFLIRFGITDEGFALSCSRGCAWRTLGWAFPATGTSIRINEYGMAPNRKAVSGQDRPDFSGVWIQVDPPLSSESSHMVQIEHRDSVFKVGVQRSGPAGVAGLYFRDERTYMIGAPPESRKDSDGRVLTLSLDWQGEALVFVRTTLEGANTITEREVWSISTDGTRLMRSRRTTDWKGASTTQSTFQKR